MTDTFSPSRLLVVRGGALGDFVLGLPALRALREAYPRARLELMAPGAALSLAAGLVDAATPLERAEAAALFADAELPAAVAARYRDLDLVVLWMADREGALRRAFARLGARRVLHAPALPPGPSLHAADHLVRTLMPLGIEGASAIPTYHPGKDALAKALQVLRGSLVSWCLGGEAAVLIHPGSGGRWKCWPAERFAEVAVRLRELGLPVALVQGPADEETVGRLLAAVPGTPPPVVAGLEVETLAALLSLAAAYLGNDSGVTHLAAAVETPTVAIFGPTDPAVWGPRGRRVVVLRSEGGALEAVSLDRVVETVNAARLQAGPAGL